MTDRGRYPYPPFELANRVLALPEESEDAYRDYEEQGRETLN